MEPAMNESEDEFLRVSVRDLPFVTVIFTHWSMDIPSGAFDEYISRGFRTTKDLAVRFGHDPSTHKVIGVPHVVDGQLRGYDCCAEIPAGTGTSGDAQTMTIAGGRYAVLTLDKDPATIGGFIERFFSSYVPRHNLSMDRSRVGYEVYSGRIMELCTPVR
jgi:DNA gyrase inhibitor GyrI